MFAHVVTFLLMFLPSAPPTGAHARASGNLTVTAVVTSSASVIFDHDGKPVVVVANAPADADSIVLASTQFDKRNTNRTQKAVKEAVDSSKKKHKGVKHASVH